MGTPFEAINGKLLSIIKKMSASQEVFARLIMYNFFERIASPSAHKSCGGNVRSFALRRVLLIASFYLNDIARCGLAFCKPE